MPTNQNVTQLTQQTTSADTSSLFYAVTGGATDTGLPLSVLVNNLTLTGTTVLGTVNTSGNITVAKTAPTLLLNGTGGTAVQIAFQNNGSGTVGFNQVYALTPNWFGLQNLTTGNYSIKVDGATDNVTLTGGLTVPGTLTFSGLTANSFIYSGTGGAVTTTSAPTNGQVLIGSTGAAPVAATLTGTTNQVNVTNGAGTITLSTPQSIATTSIPTFAGMNSTGNINCQGNVSSTANTSPAGPTNSGIALIAAPNIADIDFFDSTQTVNNRTASWLFFSGGLRGRFYNDAHSSAAEFFAVTGGQATGITGITSSSGSGSWAHTGAFSATSDISSTGNIFATVASGNTVVLTGASAGNSPTISTSGANVNISLNVNTKGSGGINLNSATAVTGTLSATGAITPSTTAGIVGTTAADNANAGAVGEFISSTVLSGSAVNLTTGTATNITSISLTAGDWDVSGNVWLSPAGTTTSNFNLGWIGTTSGTLPTEPNSGASHALSYAIVASNGAFGFPVGTTRINVSTTTTVYLECFSNFATSTMSAYGFIGARRRR